MPISEDLVERVLKAQDTGHTHDALDIVFDEFDDAFIAGEFESVDETLLEIPVEKLKRSVLHSLVVITGWAKDKLHNRNEFLNRAIEHVAKHNDVNNDAGWYEGMR